MRMQKSLLALSAGFVLFSSGSQALAQMAAPSPRVLQIYREEVKPGKNAAHEKVETGWPRAYASAKWPTYYLAITSSTGPNEAWFLSGWDSLAAWEKSSQAEEKNAALQAQLQQLSAQDGELLSGARSVVANFREDLSYRGSEVPFGKMRYFYLSTVRIRPGHDSDFTDGIKIAKKAHEAAKVPERWSVYQVSQGMPAGTYLIFEPLQSLADVDNFPQTHGEAYRNAVGDEGRKKLQEMAASGTLSSEVNIFAFSPKMSYANPEWVKADPEYWAPKPKAAPAAKKEAAKPAGQ